jgi:3-phenylpropionate/trans-cinnamate dioxygenase ferredoxin component
MSEVAGKVDLGDLSDLADGSMRAFPDIGEYGLVVCRVAGQLHALVDNCSHADAQLSEGGLRGNLLVCPRHGARFDVRNGSCQGPPAREAIACYVVHEQSGLATVDLAAPIQPE